MQSGNLTEADLQELAKSTAADKTKLKTILENFAIPQGEDAIKFTFYDDDKGLLRGTADTVLTPDHITFVSDNLNNVENLGKGKRYNEATNDTNDTNKHLLNYKGILDGLASYATAELKKLNVPKEAPPIVETKPPQPHVSATIANVAAKPAAEGPKSQSQLAVSKAMSTAILAFQQEHANQTSTPLAVLDLLLRDTFRGREPADTKIARPYDKLVSTGNAGTLDKDIQKNIEDEEKLEKNKGNLSFEDYTTQKNVIESKKTEYAYREQKRSMENLLTPEKEGYYRELAKTFNPIFEKPDWQYGDVVQIRDAMEGLPGLTQVSAQLDNFKSWADKSSEYKISDDEFNKLKNAVISGYVFNIVNKHAEFTAKEGKEVNKEENFMLLRAAELYHSNDPKNEIESFIKDNHKQPWNQNSESMFLAPSNQSYALIYKEANILYNNIIKNDQYKRLNKTSQNEIKDKFFND